MSLREKLLDFDDLRTKEVTVKAWGGEKVTVRELGMRQSMTAFGSLKVDEGGEVHLKPEEVAQAVVYGVIDPKTGKRIFTDDDVQKLADKNIKAVRFLYTEITNLSGSVDGEVKN